MTLKEILEKDFKPPEIRISVEVQTGHGWESIYWFNDDHVVEEILKNIKITFS